MDALIRISTALLLSLVLAMTSMGMASARGGMSLHGSMILCGGDYGLNSVPMGPDGRPQEAPMPCLDCTMGALAELAPLGFERPETTANLLSQRDQRRSLSHRRPETAQARGPPRLI